MDQWICYSKMEQFKIVNKEINKNKIKCLIIQKRKHQHEAMKWSWLLTEIILAIGWEEFMRGINIAS